MQFSNTQKISNFTVVAMATMLVTMATGNGSLGRTLIPDHISYRFAIGIDKHSYRKKQCQYFTPFSFYVPLSVLNESSS